MAVTGSSSSATSATTATAAAATEEAIKKVHFMFEFVPKGYAKGALPGRTGDCNQLEIQTIQDLIAQVIDDDTGFSPQDHKHHGQFLHGHYNGGKHPGFDMTYECPDTCEDFKTNWCSIVCTEELTHLGQHVSLDKVAIDLKDRMHHHTKGSHDGLIAALDDVQCLGDLNQVDLHLVVATSPFVNKKGFFDRRKNKSRRSEL